MAAGERDFHSGERAPQQTGQGPAHHVLRGVVSSVDETEPHGLCRQELVILHVCCDEGIAALGRSQLQHVAAGTSTHRYSPDRAACVYIARSVSPQALLHLPGERGQVHRLGQLPEPADADGAALAVGTGGLQHSLDLQAQTLCQSVVHPAHSGIQIGMGADSGDPALCQRQQDPSGGGLIGDRACGAEDHRVVGDDELTAQLRGLGNDLFRDIQRHQQAADGLSAPAHQEAGVVEAHLCGEGRISVQRIIDVFYGHFCHVSHSFFISSSPDTSASQRESSSSAPPAFRRPSSTFPARLSRISR